MKIVAIVDEGSALSAQDSTSCLSRIRAETDADALFVVVDGDVSRDAALPARDKFDRAAALVDAGADCVVQLPLCASLLAENLYAFAVNAMLRKLGCVDEFAFPCDTSDPNVFERTADFLLDEPEPYRRRMRAVRDENGDPGAALPEIVGQYVAGAREFLQSPQNRMAVEYRNALRRAYSPIRQRPVQAARPSAAPIQPAQERFLLRRVSELFQTRPERSAIAWASDMFAGSERLAQRVLESLRSGTCEDFRALSQSAASAGEDPVNVRRHLLGCLTGYRKVDSFVCITYNYVPYIRVLALSDRTPGLRAHLLAKAETTVLFDLPEEPAPPTPSDACKRLLMEIDDRGRALFLQGQSR